MPSLTPNTLGRYARRRQRREQAIARAREAWLRRRPAPPSPAPPPAVPLLPFQRGRVTYQESIQVGTYVREDETRIRNVFDKQPLPGMAYIAPIHRASSVRNALKLNFIDPEEECLAVAKASRLEIYQQSADGAGLELRHSKTIFGQVVVMEKIRPEGALTDHLFVCTERHCFFTLSWDAQANQLRTERSYVDLAERTARDAQSNDRCFMDPRGRYLTLALYEGIYTMLVIPWRGQRKVQQQNQSRQEIGNLSDEVVPVRIPEIMIRSSTYLHYRNDGNDREPARIATLYQNNQEVTLLKVRKVNANKSFDYISLDEEKMLLLLGDRLDPTASHLIPVPNPVNGLLVLSETCITWVNDENGISSMQPLDEATVWSTWTQVDDYRWLLADEYGYLYFLMLDFDPSSEQLNGFKLDRLGRTSRATCLVYLDGGRFFLGSHWGDSKVISIGCQELQEVQTFPNIGPILDFSIMDMGSRGGGNNQLNEYSSGQARLVTGSGAFADGSLRSVRSGVGIEEIGSLELNPDGVGSPKAATNMFHLAMSSAQGAGDLLLVSYVDETRVFHFSPDGPVEEIQQMITNEPTILAEELCGSQQRFIQCTNRSVTVYTTEGGEFKLTAHWQLDGANNIVAASISKQHIVLSIGGTELVTLDVSEAATQNQTLQELARRPVGELISCIDIPNILPNFILVGYWQNTSLSVLSLPDLKDLHTTRISSDTSAVPRSVLLTQALPNSPPTLFISLADGHVVTYDVNTQDFGLSNRQTTVLGSQQANLKILPRSDNLYSVFAIAEHSTLIYGSENRLVYSAVTAEEATCICSFNSAAYPEAVALATPAELKIAMVERKRTTHVETLPVGETVRRIAYSPDLHAFAMGTIRRTLTNGVEIVQSFFRLADEIMFRVLSEYAMNEEEIIESVCRMQLEEDGKMCERFAVGTTYLGEEDNEENPRGRLLVFEVTEDRTLKVVTETKLKGACRALATIHGKIVAALVKTLVVFDYDPRGLKKAAAYRCATAPIDIYVDGDRIVVSDLMKSVAVVEYIQGMRGRPDALEEVARHYTICWSTAIAPIDNDVTLEADAEANLIMLARNKHAYDEEGRRRLETVSEMQLGEMVNRMRPIRVPKTSAAIVDPRAFLATVSGGIYLFGVIEGDTANELLTLQSAILKKVQSPGNIPWTQYRAARSTVREESEPLRFVDGELMESFLDCDRDTQAQIVDDYKASVTGQSTIEKSVEGVRAAIEKLRRMH